MSRGKEESETEAMMRREEGGTLEAIMQSTSWQAHAVRGFVSILGSKSGFTIDSRRTPTASAPAGSRSSRAALHNQRRFGFADG